MRRALLFSSLLLLSGCRKTVKIPTCGAELVVPSTCQVRKWGNAVELDCKSEKPKIYYCNELKQESPH